MADDFYLLRRYYEYLAYTLIFGNNSPLAKDFRIYRMGLNSSFSSSLKMVELQSVNFKGKRDTVRTLKISENTNLESSNVLANEIAQIITLINKKKKIHISDAIFNDTSFIGHKKIWHKHLESRIDLLATLIDILANSKICDIPIITSDLPNITLVILDNTNICGDHNG